MIFGAHLAYWEQTLLRVVGVLLAVLLPAGTLVYLFLFKMMSFMQSRLGPMEAGPYGSMQLFAEVGKWVQKEDIHPDGADVRIFGLAPIVVVLSTFLIYVVVPFGPDAFFANLPTGVFFALAVSSVSVLGILMAGAAEIGRRWQRDPARRSAVYQGRFHRRRVLPGVRRRAVGRDEARGPRTVRARGVRAPWCLTRRWKPA